MPIAAIPSNQLDHHGRVQVWLEGDRRPDLRLGIRLRSADTLLAADTYQVVNGEVHRGVALSDPGIDDSRNAGRLKYLAGSEIGAGVFTADTLPEERVKDNAGGAGERRTLRSPSRVARREFVRADRGVM